MKRTILCVLGLSLAATAASGYSWDGEGWANPTSFLSLLDSDVKAACRAIMLSAQGQTRVAGRVGQIGDSITNSQAYLTGTLGAGTGTNETSHDFGPVMAWISPAITIGSDTYQAAPSFNCWYRNANDDTTGGSADDWRKGPVWGNESGWTVASAVAGGHPTLAVNNMNASWAVIMFGTNDIVGWSGDMAAASVTWKASYKSFVESVISLGVIPVLSTIPPRNDASVSDGREQHANNRIKEICAELNIPYIDFHAYILHHQPVSWKGGLIDTDGVHPSNLGTNFSQTSLTSNGGYRARTFLTLIMGEKLKAVVFDDGPPESPQPPTADAGGDRNVFTGNVVYLDGAGSSGLAGMTYLWTLESGPAAVTFSDATVSRPSFTPTVPGEYVIKLTVTDGNGSGEDTITVTATGIYVLLNSTSHVAVTGSWDGSVWSDSGTSSTGTDAWTRGQANDSNNYARLFLMNFDLAGIPAGTEVLNATLRVYCLTEHDERGGHIRVFGLNEAWTSSATYLTTNGTNLWSGGRVVDSMDGAFISEFRDHARTIDGTPNPDYIEAPYPYGHRIVNKWLDLDVTALVTDWQDSTRPYNGLVISNTNWTLADGGTRAAWGWVEYRWGTSANASYKPQLVVTCSESIGFSARIPNDYTMVTPNQGGDGAAFTASATQGQPLAAGTLGINGFDASKGALTLTISRTGGNYGGANVPAFPSPVSSPGGGADATTVSSTATMAGNFDDTGTIIYGFSLAGDSETINSTLTLTVGEAAPGAFNLLTPTNGATGQSLTPTLTWQTATGATAYQVQLTLNADTGFASPIINASAGGTTSYTVATALQGNTAYRWRVIASNSGSEQTISTSTFTFTTVVAPPAVSASAATNVLSTSARLNGSVTATGGQNPTVTAYWGTVDQGSTWASWDDSYVIGASGVGAFFHDVSGLAPDVTYYFRFRATNDGGDVASATLNFTTGIAGAAVTSSAATSVAQFTATLNGSITNNGGEDPVVTAYWGTADQGTVWASWSNSFEIGVRGVGAFSHNVAGLQPNTTYYFRFRAVNSGGEASSAVLNFTTLIAPPSLTTLAINGLEKTQATLRGSVTSTGGDNPTVTVYWGLTDEGDTWASWASSQTLGVFSLGQTFSYEATGLAVDTKYYYRFRAANSAGEGLTEVKNFTTLSELTGLGEGDGCVPGAAGPSAAGLLAMLASVLAIRRRK